MQSISSSKAIKPLIAAVCLTIATFPAFASTAEDMSDILPGIEVVGEAQEQDLETLGEGRAKKSKASAKHSTKPIVKGLSTLSKYAGNPAKKLVDANMKIYHFAGWQAGKLLAPADPGPYPGYPGALKAMGIGK